MKNKSLSNARYLALLAMLVAIELLVGLIPMLGYIPVGALHLTIVHIPVIIGALLLGPKAGGILGFFFGLTSLLNATFLQPNPIESPLFSPFFVGGPFQGNVYSLLICFVPRILVGVVAGYLFILLSKIWAPKGAIYAFSSVVASFVNTVLVLGGIYLFFAEPYAAANSITTDVLFGILMGVVALNGVFEAILAALVTTIVVYILMPLVKRD